MATSSSASTNGPKISMLKAKTGFVIPKNKLSGSLVPAYKGAKKSDGSDLAHEESTKQTQRKTKWGPDLTQDATVRKGRALAYQTRVDQITQLLESGSLESRNVESSTSDIKAPEHEQLELEKLEAIGEILKINPTYKAPYDYKPLAREARVPLPMKEDVGYKFVSMVFGPSEAQKRVEKETGATIRVYGTKLEGGKKIQVEVSASDGSDVVTSYVDLTVLVSADSYEKVDAAVSLIELLVSSVSGKSAADAPSVEGDDTHTDSKIQDAATEPTVAMHNQGPELSLTGSLANPHGNIQPNPIPWPQMGPSQTPGFINPPNSSGSVVSNPMPFYPSNMPSFAPRPGHVPAYGSAPLNSNFVPPRSQPPLHVFPNMFTSLPHPSGQSNTPSNSGVSPFSAHQHPGHLTERPGTPGNSGWSGAPMSTPIFTGPNSASQIAPPVSSASMITGPPLPPLQPGPSPGSSTSLPPRPLHGPISLPLQPQSSASMLVQHFGQVPTSPNNTTSMGSPIPRPIPPAIRPMQHGIPGLGPGGIPGPSYTPIRSMGGPAPVGQHNNTGDFTYQPHRPPNGQSLMQFPPAPPSFRPAMQGANSQHLMQAPPPRPPMGNQMGLQPPHSANPSQVPPSNMNAHMGVRNHNQFPPSAGAPFLTRPGNAASFQQAPPFARPGNPFSPNQVFRQMAPGRPNFSPSGGHQFYDPFSPTSVPAGPQHQGGNTGNVARQENDPEYEDLMASVGVK